MSDLHVGDRVSIETLENWGGDGVIVAERPSSGSRFKVRLDDGSQPDFWAHDFEIVQLREPSKKEGYDSRPETHKHIREVQARLGQMIEDLACRQRVHDESKLVSPEVEAFDEFTPKLRASTYGSPEYEEYRKSMGPALAHHYAHNRHHPEFFANGIQGMDLLDLVELLCDWAAAVLRHADGDLAKSIEINQKRFGYSDELKGILRNTAERMFGVPVKETT